MNERKITNVRDLLIHTIAPEMGEARSSGVMASRYPDLSRDEATVAWVLDAMTVLSLETLAELRRTQGEETKPF